ncbi:hypothetical protein ABVT39_020794 [Epinephelus coioides]
MSPKVNSDLSFQYTTLQTPSVLALSFDYLKPKRSTPHTARRGKGRFPHERMKCETFGGFADARHTAFKCPQRLVGGCSELQQTNMPPHRHPNKEGEPVMPTAELKVYGDMNLNKYEFLYKLDVKLEIGAPGTGWLTCLGALRFISIHGELSDTLANALTVWQQCTSLQAQSLGRGSRQMLLQSEWFNHSSGDSSKKICLHTTATAMVATGYSQC